MNNIEKKINDVALSLCMEVIRTKDKKTYWSSIFYRRHMAMENS